MLCFVVVIQSFIMNSHEVFIHIHQGCFAGTGAIVRLPQCQWSEPDGYGKTSQCITTTKHSTAKTVCIFLGIYCILNAILITENIRMVPMHIFIAPGQQYFHCCENRCIHLTVVRPNCLHLHDSWRQLLCRLTSRKQLVLWCSRYCVGIHGDMYWLL